MSEFMPGPERERIGNYLGLAQRAGKVAAGDLAATKALKAAKVTLLVLAEDISPKTARDILQLAVDIPVLWWPDKLALGLLVGKSHRGALALNDAGFTKAILKLVVKKE